MGGIQSVEPKLSKHKKFIEEIKKKYDENEINDL